MPDSAPTVRLTAREEEILRELCRSGASDPALAQALGMHRGTVKAHLRALRRATGSENRSQLVIWGKDHGYGEAKAEVQS
jgi:DNA-binding CsgD family transcriptional regulator